MSFQINELNAMIMPIGFVIVDLCEAADSSVRYNSSHPF
ncbi:hypothetical protein GPUN_2807 [Glaciecola punicea ACAM 611]|uniref:Uncharacterized protein n=1 Tax=Glaciecola punicea ACAM 611 TaxID=1121923 RepID=H5TEZ4_9ALTE|nr:hypothetical protein GPUN_2807 [Glaciecola punicea ACAM 611]